MSVMLMIKRGWHESSAASESVVWSITVLRQSGEMEKTNVKICVDVKVLRKPGWFLVICSRNKLDCSAGLSFWIWKIMTVCCLSVILIFCEIVFGKKAVGVVSMNGEWRMFDMSLHIVLLRLLWPVVVFSLCDSFWDVVRSIEVWRGVGEKVESSV